ncbi:MAG: hypothetical protein ACLRWP_11100 [Bilophila wadsworthia]
MHSIVTACDAYTAKGVTSAQDGFTQEKQWAQLRKAHEKDCSVTACRSCPASAAAISTSSLLTLPVRR